ncbi:hypothetical protein B5P41_35140, partial [Bacillus sp. SRB_28]
MAVTTGLLTDYYLCHHFLLRRFAALLDLSNVVYTVGRFWTAGSVRHHPSFITAARSGRAERNA